jgi:hypothetical protein
MPVRRAECDAWAEHVGILLTSQFCCPHQHRMPSGQRKTSRPQPIALRAAPSQIAARQMEKDYLVLKRASASRPSGEWSDDDYDVLAEGVIVGRIMKAAASPVETPWLWTLAFGHHEDRTPTHGYAATREAAMAAFAKSWRQE